MSNRAFAPAKVNLYLHVGPLGADGYHPIESWMAFADVGDELVLDPAPAMAFTVDGPYAAQVPDGPGNLVVRARDAALAAVGFSLAPFSLALTKNLPPASGVGGGSSDAAAALRLVGQAAYLSAETLDRLAAGLGADVPACLAARSLIARGRGEFVSAAPLAAPLNAVLVNPGAPVSTAAVFAAYDRLAPGAFEPMPVPLAFDDLSAVAAFLAGTRNDLQTAAMALEPAIGEVLKTLEAAPQTVLARMTGSGATCFALCPGAARAQALAARLAHDHPAWWVRACALA